MSYGDSLTKEDVMKVVAERNISFIQFWFTDVLGVLKTFAVTPSELEMGMAEGMGFERPFPVSVALIMNWHISRSSSMLLYLFRIQIYYCGLDKNVQAIVWIDGTFLSSLASYLCYISIQN